MKIEIKARGLFSKGQKIWNYTLNHWSNCSKVYTINSSFPPFKKKPPSFYFNLHENPFTDGSSPCGKYPFLLLIQYVSVHTRNSSVLSNLTCGTGTFSTKRWYYEKQIAKDCNDNGNHVQCYPTPLVVFIYFVICHNAGSIEINWFITL